MNITYIQCWEIALFHSADTEPSAFGNRRQAEKLDIAFFKIAITIAILPLNFFFYFSDYQIFLIFLEVTPPGSLKESVPMSKACLLDNAYSLQDVTLELMLNTSLQNQFMSFPCISDCLLLKEQLWEYLTSPHIKL